VDFDELESVRRSSAAWKLLRADNASLVLAVLGKIFVDENVREISQTDLISRIDDELYAINDSLDEPRFPKTAKAYLDDWSAADSKWLRKYYTTSGSDEPHFDAEPALEKALAFVRALKGRDFVGTESRLNTVFELLRQMVHGTETDPDKRIHELRRQRQALDEEIARVERGDLSILTPTAQRDRFQQFVTTARDLLSDFRQVEANFRSLDRELRETIAGWQGSKGELLDQIVADRGDIANTDQGRTFTAFYDFLLSASRQAEFEDLLERALELESLGEVDPRVRRIHHDWLEAGERTQATVRLLSEQLRRFLDDTAWLENRRIVEILKSISATAVSIREQAASAPGCELDGAAPAFVLPMERRLYTPKQRTPIDSALADDQPGLDEPGSDALFEQTYVDTARLSEQVRNALATSGQVPLTAIVGAAPLEHGLAELVAYLALSDESFTTIFDDAATDEIAWSNGEEVERVATLPRTGFVRRRSGSDLDG